MATCTPQTCQQLAEAIAADAPRLDGVLHNAGVLGDVVPMSEQVPAVWDEVMQVNINATFISPRRCFLYYCDLKVARWCLPLPALGDRGVLIGARMPSRSSRRKA